MLLLHLSDIHFRSGESGTPFDPSQLLRARLVDDARTMCTRLNDAVGAVLVSGDIAYAGKSDEFGFAKGWLEELATACGATLAHVFTCPGNHDADRSIARSPPIRGITSRLGQLRRLRGMLQFPAYCSTARAVHC